MLIRSNLGAPIAGLALLSLCISAIQAYTDFVHLFSLKSGGSRLHLSSEIVENGYRVTVEEFLDFSTMNQLVQIKWNDGFASKEKINKADDRLKTRKLNIVVLNEGQQSVMYQYEPYKCNINQLGNGSFLEDNADWNSFRLEEGFEKRLSDGEIYKNLVSSISSLAPNSPYLTRISQTKDNTKHDIWLFSISGLWAKAQFSESPVALFEPEASAIWRLEFGDTLVDYYMNSMLLKAQSSAEKLIKKDKDNDSDLDDLSRGYENDAPSLIEIKDRGKKATIQVINIFEVEFGFSDQLAKNLFKLPIGFNCPSNPLIDKSKVQFRDQTSQLVKLEIVANKFKGLHSESLYSETVIKNVEIARVRHPVDSGSSLIMFRCREDRFKLVFDYYYNLEYHVQFKGPAQRCGIRHLKFMEDTATSRRHLLTTNPLFFDNNILLDLNQYHLDYLLRLKQEDLVKQEEDMRLLNVFEVNDDKNEIIFESQVPDEHRDMLTLTNSLGLYVDRHLTIVRVYEQQAVKAPKALGKRPMRGFVELKRVLILVFSADRGEKLAEVRLNLVEELTQLLSFTQRAKLFDLSDCFDSREETMQLVASYPADPNLLEYVQEHDQALLDRFYGSSIDWQSMGNQGQEEDNDATAGRDIGALAKQRLGLSVNFLRMPKVELLGSVGGELELHVTLLDKVSPLHSFERVTESTFVIEADDEEADEKGSENVHLTSMLLESPAECANYCRLYDCKIFSFNSMKQCKFSQLPFLTERASSDLRIASSSQPTIKLSLESFSQVYFEPEQTRGKLLKEATLAELSAYFEHYSNELATYFSLSNQDDDEDGDGDTSTRTNRSRRHAGTPEVGQPLFAFDFVDRSNLKSEYEPAQMRMLIPTELSITHLPLVLDVGEALRAGQVIKSFQTMSKSHVFSLTKIDSPDETPKQISNEDERTFVDGTNEFYYTLRRVSAIGQDNCALLCYNIEEWNAKTRSEQVCVSFSYSKYNEQCVLVVRTDFSFVANILELVEQGDRVLKLEALDQLLEDSYDGIVAVRNFLPEFEGPIKLPASVHGYQTTAGAQFGLELEWLAAIASDSNVDIQEEKRENCALACNARNKIGKSLCLAFDFCSTTTKSRETHTKRHKILCDLLLLVGADAPAKSGHPKAADIEKIARLRNHLTQRVGRFQAEPAGAKTGQNETVLADTCNRYLLSHLREFTHLNQRQVAVEESPSRLERLSETFDGLNLDRCALECSLRGAQCIIFEFCMSTDIEHQISLNCTLFKATDLQANKRAELAAAEAENEQDVAASKLLTSYNKNCHVYLRKEFSSIEQALSSARDADRLAPSDAFDHTLLSVCFSIVYLSMVACVLVYVVRKRRSIVRQRALNAERQANERLAMGNL